MAPTNKTKVDAKAEKPHNPAMNKAIIFDTHRYFKRLVKTGFSEEQAEAMLEAQMQFFNANMATKSDIAKARTKADLAEVITFDIHRFVKRLVKTGFTEKQAEALLELWSMFAGG